MVSQLDETPVIVQRFHDGGCPVTICRASIDLSAKIGNLFVNKLNLGIELFESFSQVDARRTICASQLVSAILDDGSLCLKIEDLCVNGINFCLILADKGVLSVTDDTECADFGIIDRSVLLLKSAEGALITFETRQ